MSFNRGILRTYAQLPEPESLPPNVYFTHTEDTTTIFDAYPKAIFHFLVLPRIKDKEGALVLSGANLTSLKVFLNSPQTSIEDARSLLTKLKDDGEKVREMILEEMRSRFGFVWDVCLGFHAVQSMDHTHLHVISQDLCAPGLKTKKHYNSFHPKLGFFLHLDEVLSWFEEGNAESFMRKMMKLDQARFEKKLKEPLECFHCAEELKNIPTLKTHLQEHFKKMEQKGKKAEADKKRKRDHAEENVREKQTDLDRTMKQEVETENSEAVESTDLSVEAPPKAEDSKSGTPQKRQRSA